jgi:hypothetical protein
MNKEQMEIPDDEGNPFLDLGGLLGKVSVAMLASAIEKCGIYTWDRFGRYGLADEAGNIEALHLLEIHYEWESTPPQERPDPRSPMDQWGCHSDNAYGHFGWATKVLPDFDNMLSAQEALNTEKINSLTPKPPGRLNHDPRMQQRANEIAAELKTRTGREPTKDEVAGKLESEFHVSIETVLRRIRAQWKKKPLPRYKNTD